MLDPYRKFLTVLVAAQILLASSALAEEPAHPKQWQHQAREQISLPIDPTRCVKVYYGPELQKERDGYLWGIWVPPLSDKTLLWIEAQILSGSAVAEYCEDSRA